MNLWCDRIITGGILFLVLCTPFAFGSVHPWAYSTMEAVIFSLVIVWMAKVAILAREQGAGSRGQRSGGSSHFAIRNSKFAIRSPALPLALFLLLALFQLMPLPPSLLRTLSPQTYEAYTQILPGWPERAPYADMTQRSEVRDQRSEVRGRRAGRREQGAGSIRHFEFRISNFAICLYPHHLAPALPRSRTDPHGSIKIRCLCGAFSSDLALPLWRILGTSRYAVVVHQPAPAGTEVLSLACVRDPFHRLVRCRDRLS